MNLQWDEIHKTVQLYSQPVGGLCPGSVVSVYRENSLVPIQSLIRITIYVMSIVTSHTHGLVCVKDGLYNLGIITNRFKNCWWFNKKFSVRCLCNIYGSSHQFVDTRKFSTDKICALFFSSSLSKLKCYKQNNTLLTALFFFFLCVKICNKRQNFCLLRFVRSLLL